MFIAQADYLPPALRKERDKTTFRSYGAGLNRLGTAYKDFASPRRGVSNTPGSRFPH